MSGINGAWDRSVAPHKCGIHHDVFLGHSPPAGIGRHHAQLDPGVFEPRVVPIGLSRPVVDHWRGLDGDTERTFV